VHVSARDLGTGKEQSIRITATSGLSDDDIDQIIKEAEEHEEDDRKIKELVELRNQGEGLVYTTEQSLEEFGDRLEDEDKELIAERVQDVKDVLESNDVEEVRNAVNNLSEAAHKLAEALYSQAGADYEEE
jgi:molecular chaperone DnaK